MKVRDIKQRVIASMLASTRVNFLMGGRASAYFRSLSQAQRDSLAAVALRRALKEAGRR